MSYNKRTSELEIKKNKVYNRYWEKINKKMQRLYFWECVIKKKSTFEMVFEHKGFKDDEILIEFYANKNGLHIVDERLLRTKSIYSFGKAN